MRKHVGPPLCQEHGFTLGFCPHGCALIVTHEDRIREMEQRVAWLFPKKRKLRARNVDKESIVLALQNVHLAKAYPFGVPKTFITAACLRAPSRRWPGEKDGYSSFTIKELAGLFFGALTRS